jgi:hypothetical protein
MKSKLLCGILLLWALGATGWGTSEYLALQQWRKTGAEWQASFESYQQQLQACQDQLDTTKTSQSLIPYEILSRDENQHFKVSYEIQVDLVAGRLPTAEELGRISQSLYAQERQHDRTFVTFLLPDMVSGAGAFASAHHDPEMEVKIYEDMIPMKYKGGSHEPPVFDSVATMVEFFGDFDAESGTFQIIEEAPVMHIQVSATFLEDGDSAFIREENHRVMLDMLYKVFIHTSLPAVKVTGLPVLFDMQAKTRTDLADYVETLHIERSQAQAVAQDLFRVTTLQDLVETEQVGDDLYPRWTQQFDSAFYHDAGSPTLDQFWSAVRQVAL